MPTTTVYDWGNSVYVAVSTALQNFIAAIPAVIGALLNQVILWIPNLIVAAVILLIAPLIGRFLRRLIEVGAGQMGFTNARLLGRLAEIAVIVFAVVIAINQIGIAA